MASFAAVDDMGLAIAPPSLVFTTEQRQLWNNHSVEQLHALELKLRTDCDEKREELRQLVGLKYRDLIQSADSIVHMKDIAFGALQNLQSTYCVHCACA